MMGSRHSSASAFAAAALLAATALLAGGCQHVQPAAGASEVRVMTNQDAASRGCTRLGETRVEVVAKVWFVQRSEEKVAAELETLARNEALALDGNAVAPTGEVDEGKRDYTIYRCE